MIRLETCVVGSVLVLGGCASAPMPDLQPVTETRYVDGHCVRPMRPGAIVPLSVAGWYPLTPETAPGLMADMAEGARSDFYMALPHFEYLKLETWLKREVRVYVEEAEAYFRAVENVATAHGDEDRQEEAH